jgi:ATP-binding cassette subfamily C (CFTR/MRP) protein 1
METIARPEKKRALPLALYRCLKQPFLAAILPRLFLVIFKYSQPILIKESIRYVTASETFVSSIRGYWIVVSGIAVYAGLAVGIKCIEIVTRLLTISRSQQLYTNIA